jgi:hypothetical protein
LPLLLLLLEFSERLGAFSTDPDEDDFVEVFSELEALGFVVELFLSVPKILRKSLPIFRERLSERSPGLLY